MAAIGSLPDENDSSELAGEASQSLSVALRGGREMWLVGLYHRVGGPARSAAL